jgi:hypothetical protein
MPGARDLTLTTCAAPAAGSGHAVGKPYSMPVRRNQASASSIAVSIELRL